MFYKIGWTLLVLSVLSASGGVLERVVENEQDENSIANSEDENNVCSSLDKDDESNYGHCAQKVLAQDARDEKQACGGYCALRGRPTLDNTYCRNPSRSRNCGQVFYSSVSADERQEILDLHNDIRRKIANGQDQNFRYTASNMQQLYWDEELARGARLWAEQCDFSHDSNRNVCRFQAGQNLFISGSSSTPKADWKEPVKAWYDEVHLYRDHPSRMESGNFMEIGHFTQVIWAETKYIGCHSIGFPEYPFAPSFNAEYYVCNYGPGGNFIGSPILETGTACSGCPDQFCNNGLCA